MHKQRKIYSVIMWGANISGLLSIFCRPRGEVSGRVSGDASLVRLFQVVSSRAARGASAKIVP